MDKLVFLDTNAKKTLWYGGIKMGHKKSLKAKLALVGIILLVVLTSFSFWTHRDDVFHGFDAGFEQSK